MPSKRVGNPSRVGLNRERTLLAVQAGVDTIDITLASLAGSKNPNEMVLLKDTVHDELVKLPFWKPAWTDYPSDCWTPDGSSGLWSLIVIAWSRLNPGYTLVADDVNGRHIGTWRRVDSVEYTRKTLMITIEDAWSRADNETKKFSLLHRGSMPDALLTALQEAAAEAHRQAQAVIRETAKISDDLNKKTPADLRKMYGWRDPNDAIDTLENRATYRTRATRTIGKELWDHYKVRCP